MTSAVMQRPRSTQPSDFASHSGSNDDELYRSVSGGSGGGGGMGSVSGADSGVPRMANIGDSTVTSVSAAAAATDTNNGGSMLSGQGSMSGSGIASPPALGMLGQEGDFSGAFRSFALDPSSSSTIATPSMSDAQLNSRDVASSSSLSHVDDSGRGIFDDPAILALVGDQPFDPRIDFELDLQNEALSAGMQPQQQPSTSFVPQPQYSSSSSNSAQPAVAGAAAASAPVVQTSLPPSSSLPSTSIAALENVQPYSQSAPTISLSAAAKSLPNLNLTSVDGILQFPELPASLLDQAPEYEYSLHTQANVFDAVQDYQGAGDDEAARMFYLDNYDPSLGMAGSSADAADHGNILQGAQHNHNTDDLWRYNDSSITTSHATDPSSGSSFEPHGLHSGDGFASSFADTSSMISSSEYPVEPSSAPTSRSSEWKVDPASAAAAAAAAAAASNASVISTTGISGGAAGGGATDNGGAGNYSGQTTPNAKRRRESSLDSRPVETAGTNSLMAPPPTHHGAFMGQQNGGGGSNSTAGASNLYGAHAMSNDARLINGRSVNREPMVPSQGLGAGGMQRARLQSWNGTDASGAPQRLSADGWSAQMQAQAQGASLYDHHGAQAGMMNGNGAYGVTSFEAGPGPQGMMGMSMNEAHAASTNIARTEMINALGSAMDASLESDGVAKCPYPNCSKTFAKNRSYNLKAHLRSHSQLKPFQCIHCPRAFSRKHDLERHTRVHSGDKPYLCEACGKGFPRSDALRRHWRVEKECGDKAVEIEAKTPLPSLPPGANTPAAQAKGPTPGYMHFGAPTTTAAALSNLGMAATAQSGVVNPFLPVHSVASGPHHPAMSAVNATSAPVGWESSVPPSLNPYANVGGALVGGSGHYHALMEQRKKRSRDEV